MYDGGHYDDTGEVGPRVGAMMTIASNDQCTLSDDGNTPKIVKQMMIKMLKISTLLHKNLYKVDGNYGDQNLRLNTHMLHKINIVLLRCLKCC